MRSLTFALLLSPVVLHGQALEPLDPMRSGPDSTLAPFYHGVASGDPLADRVILWTRMTTDGADAEIAWRVALDTAMSAIVAEGSVMALADNDHTVRVDVSGLQPFTFYYYEFEAPDGRRSVRGRTRTLPVGSGVDSIRFAVVSCSNYAHGFFNAYDKIRERNDIFAVIHLGDYIYEYGDGDFGDERALDPSFEILDLGDYRLRHSHYKLDPDLMRLHQQYPFFSVWDDHETANNSWMGGAQNHTSDEGDWFARKSAGIRAYAEWMPLRLPDPADTLRIYRRFDLGDLLTLHMLDTRLIGREEQGGVNTAPERTLLGTQQYDWLASGMSASQARWQVLGQQVMMAPLRAFGVAVNDDQWDGYPAERQRVYDHVLGNGIRNMVVLTGDIHTSWANDLPLSGYNALTGENSAGVEFVTTSVTSTSFNLPIPNLLIQVFNTHVKHVDLTQRGYLIFDVNRERVQGDWYYLNTVTAPNAQEQVGASRQSVDQSRHLTAADAPSVAGTALIGTPAPFAPRNDLSVATMERGRSALLVGAYPNPFTDRLDIHYFANGNADVTAQLFDGNGRLLVDRALGRPGAGVHKQRIQLPTLPEGVYLLRLVSGEGVLTTRLVKVDRP